MLLWAAVAIELRKRIREEARAGQAFKRRISAIDQEIAKDLKAMVARGSRRRVGRLEKR